MFHVFYNVFTDEVVSAMDFFVTLANTFFTMKVGELFPLITSLPEGTPDLIVRFIENLVNPVFSVLSWYFGDVTIFAFCFGASILVFIALTLVKWVVELIPVI